MGDNGWRSGHECRKRGLSLPRKSISLLTMLNMTDWAIKPSRKRNHSIFLKLYRLFEQPLLVSCLTKMHVTMTKFS